MDHFSTGRLSAWGRPIAGSSRGSLKRVDEPGFWDHARFTYWFLKEDGAENSHVYHQGSTEFPDYANLHVNHAEALAIWPVSGVPQDDRTEIMLLDAARRLYSETRNDPAAVHAEAFGNTPEKILTWYCIWLAQHMQIYGARRPFDQNRASQPRQSAEGLRHHEWHANDARALRERRLRKPARQAR